MDAGCGKRIKEYVPRGYDYKEITVRCGSTSPDGYPWQCSECEKKNAHIDWRHQAELNGEAWGPEDY